MAPFYAACFWLAFFSALVGGGLIAGALLGYYEYAQIVQGARTAVYVGVVAAALGVILRVAQATRKKI